MKKKSLTKLLMLAVSAVLLTGCVQVGVSNEAGTSNSTAVETENQVEEEVAEDSNESGEADLEAAQKVADLIDAIYVQIRTDETDAQCLAAKEAWDALTDEQKELVEGENADPDYFGRDTGDAAKDDPRNADDISENEILVASFGTSFNASRAEDIKGVEDALAEAFPDWSVRRAFTAQIIINHIQARDGEAIDNVDQALQRAVDNGVKNLVIQPTHLMHGAEYDELVEALDNYKEKFESVAVAEPLLGQVGEDASVINDDKKSVAESITGEAVAIEGYDTIAAAKEDGVAFVFMGHGTSHTAKVSYSQMQHQMDELGYDNVFIGTVEGEPEETECSNVIGAVKDAGYKTVVLRPLMVVAGDHANNDMAGDEEDSWKSQFIASDAFDEVRCQIAGLGGIKAIEDIYVAHTADAIKSLESVADGTDEDVDIVVDLEDGEYQAAFDTDSSMFHVNEALDGMGTLTVKDGKMTIHVSLAGKGVLNLYPGLAKDAENAADDELLLPTEDEVTYADGTTETVYGFDVPVEVLDEEFDLALIGKKGQWYDHKVVVSTPEN